MYTFGLNNEREFERSALEKTEKENMGQRYTIGKIRKVSRALQKDNVF